MTSSRPEINQVLYCRLYPLGSYLSACLVSWLNKLFLVIFNMFFPRFFSISGTAVAALNLSVKYINSAALFYFVSRGTFLSTRTKWRHGKYHASIFVILFFGVAECLLFTLLDYSSKKIKAKRIHSLLQSLPIIITLSCPFHLVCLPLSIFLSISLTHSLTHMHTQTHSHNIHKMTKERNKKNTPLPEVVKLSMWWRFKKAADVYLYI